MYIIVLLMSYKKQNNISRFGCISVIRRFLCFFNDDNKLLPLVY